MPSLFNNLWVKVAALLLAILLWFHVATEKVYQNQITLPVTQVDLPTDLVLVEPPPESVLVTVSSGGKALLRSDWKRRGAKMQITDGRPGRFKQDIASDNVALIDAQGVTLVDVVGPREFYFNCDRRGEKEVPVKSRVVILPDEGFALGNADSLIPATVTITGPRAALTAVEAVETESERLEGVRNDFDVTVALVYPDIYNLSITPDSVTQYISLVPLKTREFVDLALRLTYTPFGRMVNYEPKSIDIIVRGRTDFIDRFEADQITATADYREADSAGAVPVVVSLPETVSLVHQSVDTVRITQ